MAGQENILTTLMEAPNRMSRFIDACTCGRTDKAAVVAIRKQLEDKDTAIERLEEEIRRKDTEKDNLIHMQKDLQSQIEEIRLLLDSQAGDVKPKSPAKKPRSPPKKRPELTEEERAAVRMQAARRGKSGRVKADEKKAQSKVALSLQSRHRGRSARKMVEEKASEGVLPGQNRGNRASPPGPPTGGLPTASPGTVAASIADSAGAGFDVFSADGASSFLEDESVDSDYDFDESAFSGLGRELLAGQLKLAKVYGQEEPPAAEDELEWEVRYFVLHENGKMCHYDEMADGLPQGDRGLIDLATITGVEKCLHVPTFVMKGANKVYLFKLEPHDEVMMRTWISSISQELNARLAK